MDAASGKLVGDAALQGQIKSKPENGPAVARSCLGMRGCAVGNHVLGRW